MKVLPVVAPSIEGDDGGSNLRWLRFEERRDELLCRSELATCNGCHACSIRCVDGFGVTEEEYRVVRAYLATEAGSEAQRVAEEPKTFLWPGAEETGATVTYCRYRENATGRCSIYPVRPTICRLFGHVEWLPCPIERISAIPEGGATLWNTYRQWERRTWIEWDREDGNDPIKKKNSRKIVGKI